MVGACRSPAPIFCWPLRPPSSRLPLPLNWPSLGLAVFRLTEPAVASSDATNIESSIIRDGDEYVINGRKWYTTNGSVADILIVMAVTATWMTVALPTWKQRSIREKEAELVFRGQQYVRALRPRLAAAYPSATFVFLPADIVSQILNFGIPAPINVWPIRICVGYPEHSRISTQAGQ